MNIKFKFMLYVIILFNGFQLCHASSDALLLENVTYLNTKTGAYSSGNFILVEHGVITYIGEEQPSVDGAKPKMMDLSGKFLLPSFIDTHAHATLGEILLSMDGDAPALIANNSDDIARWNGRKLLEWGITNIRNPGGDTSFFVSHKKQRSKDDWVGPKVKMAGSILDKNKFAGLSTVVGSEKSIEDEIKRQKLGGMDYIKIYASMSKDEIKHIVEVTNQFNMETIAHLDGVSWTDASKLGVDSLVHAMPTSPDLLSPESREKYLKTKRIGSVNFFEWYESVDLQSKEMKELYKTLSINDTKVDLNLIVFYNAFFGNKEHVTNNQNIKLVHPELLNNWKTFFNFNIGWSKSDYERAQKVWPKVLQFAEKLYDSGVFMTVGTDLGNPWVIPGYSFHQELELLSSAGIPNKDILKMATFNGAKLLDIDDEYGSIAVGKIADFVVLNKNPLEDIRHTQSIDSVIQDGKILGKEVF